MKIDKDELRKEFTKNWKKHYDIQILKENGFSRKQCKNCGKWFWSIEEREYCADASCIGYQFIGNPASKNKIGYVEAWKKIEKYFTKNGHESVKPYPTVARWRDDLYFTIASINDFQPYVVNGELPPPANPLIIPQPCIRFPDIENVGFSGRHYTNFVMIGQHAFNTEKGGLFYWKNEALGHDILFMKELGIPKEKMVFVEDVWAGGGNFGPSIEYFVDGLELGNCVFMQYEFNENGRKELNTKVIDMGAGLERFPWITNGEANSYITTFRKTIDILKKITGVSVDEKLQLEYAKMSGRLNADENDIVKEKQKITDKIGVEFVNSLKPLQALYATADHTATILFTSTDGMLPSNSGGGYNLRMILRRIFGFEEEFGFDLDYGKIIDGHVNEKKLLFPYLKEGAETAIEIIEEEKKKYKETRRKTYRIVENFIKHGKITDENLIVMYKSHGIIPESIVEEAKKHDKIVKIPPNFYKMIQEGEGEENKVKSKNKDGIIKSIENKNKRIDLQKIEKTIKNYYGTNSKFKATVLKVVGGEYVVLDNSSFYAESGGQIADNGTINRIEVIDVINYNGVFFHKIKDGGKKIKEGQKVECVVDLERRTIITRHHTGAHLLNAACRKILGQHIWQGGSNNDENKAHLDITHYRRITNEELNRIEIEVNEYIMRNAKIDIEVMQRNKAEEEYGFRLYQGGAIPGKELRIVKIEDIDVEACGGTHHMLKRTGEIGCFKIVKREGIKDGIERITYKCGSVALKYIQMKEALLRKTAGIVDVSEYDLPKTMSRFFEEWKSQRKNINQLKNIIAIEEAKKISSNKQEINIVNFDKETMKQVSSVIINEKKKPITIMINKAGFVLCISNDDKKRADEILNKLIKKYGGSGGGNKKFAFGKIKQLPKKQ